jgi:acetyl esterase
MHSRTVVGRSERSQKHWSSRRPIRENDVPLHPTAAAILPLWKEAGLDLGPDTPPAEARAKMNATVGALPTYPLFRVEARTIPGPAGEVPLRVYRPSDDFALPIVVWFHGGGWVLGSLDTHDNLCRQLSEAVDAIVVSVDYRLAPEAKFPAALDDCVAAWVWVTAHASELGGDPARVALGGDSAGGNLAAAACLVAREEHLPAPEFQLLVYPVTDFEFSNPSMIDNAVGYGLETDHMRWFFDHYARTPADCEDWRMSPLRSDLHDLPPALVVTAEYDPLRDQGEAYAEKLEAAGVETARIRADGLFHGFFGMHGFLEPARGAWDRAVELLRTVLHPNHDGN